MADIPSTRDRLYRVLVAGGVILILSSLLVFPSAARTDIQTIQNGDMVFIYEQDLDITALRTGGNVVTSLRKYQDDDPAKGLLRDIPVADDTSFSLIPEAFGDTLGIWRAFNATAGAMGTVIVRIPSVSIDAVLASPNHVDTITGLTIPESTRIAFKIVSIDVGSTYRAGALFPATVDLVMTTPGGAQLTTIQGRDFSRMNVSSQVFYTDDPGRPGAITLEGLGGTGTFAIQAKWRDPASFYMQAPASNIISFTVGRPATTPTTPAPATTPTTPRTTATTPVPVTTPATTAIPTTTTAAPTTATPSPTATAATSPAPTPTGAWIAFLSPAVAALYLLWVRKGRP